MPSPPIDKRYHVQYPRCGYSHGKNIGFDRLNDGRRNRKKPPTRAIIYARFSPRRDEENCTSIEQQKAICEEWCAKNDIKVIGFHHDEALSGADEDRPGLWNAVAELPFGGILLVSKLDRLARDPGLAWVIERKVEAKGRGSCRVVSVAGEGTENNSPEQVMFRRVIQTLAEYERKVTAARTKAAMLRHQMNSRRMSAKPPYGWDVDPNDPKRLVRNADEQTTISLIAAWHADNFSFRKICGLLSENKRFARTGKRFHPMAIKRIVTRLTAEAGMIGQIGVFPPPKPPASA